MRKHNAADALFPHVRRQILSATMINPKKSWYLTELAHHLKTTPSSLQRELDSLSSAGIIKRVQQRHRVLFQAETEAPFFNDLRNLLVKTCGIVDVIQNSLSEFKPKIQVAFIYGSFAHSQTHIQSDIDLLVIGSLSLEEASPPLRKAESVLGRDVNFMCLSENSLYEKNRSENSFILNILTSKKLFIFGDSNVLQKIVGNKQDSSSYPITPGNRKPAKTDRTRSS
jgi:predicted nucleotidyltransferase